MSIYDTVNDMTFDVLLEKCLALVRSDVDKRPGSVIYDAIAPAMAVLAEAYLNLSDVISAVDIDVAEGEDLDRLVKAVGITRTTATQATIEVVFWELVGSDFIPLEVEYDEQLVSVGEEQVVYTVIEQEGELPYIGTEERNPDNVGKYCYRSDEDTLVWVTPEEGKVAYFGVGGAITWALPAEVPGGSQMVPWVVDLSYKLICEEYGDIGNTQAVFVPMASIENLAEIEYKGLVTVAADPESDEALRTRYLEWLDVKPFAGNLAAYKEMLTNWVGPSGARVGQVQIFGNYEYDPTGETAYVPGAVRLSITNSANRAPAGGMVDLIEELWYDIDPWGDAGGRGRLPIGHTLNVVAPTEVPVTVKLLSGTVDVTPADILQIKAAITKLFEDKRATWGAIKNDGTYEVTLTSTELVLVLLAIRPELIGLNISFDAGVLTGESDLVFASDATNQELPVLGSITLDTVEI